MDNREAITRELLSGTAPYDLYKNKTYPKSTVYKIRDELIESGQLQGGVIPIAAGESSTAKENENPFVRVTPSSPKTEIPAGSSVETSTETRTREQTGADIISSEATLPADAVNRIRGILGITLRPKVLSCPMPELLYPSMVIAVTELGFPAMRPDDFIDTVLYQWLEACDYIPYAYMKKSELDDIVKSRGVDEDYIKEHGLMTEEEFASKHGISLPEPEGEKVETTESTVEVPHKPTIGELLSKLHISSIEKEVKDDSAGRTESISPQGEHEPIE